ncbi:MAG TPA: Ldh family oxidoreductase [Ramlibacter sp.]|jgi:L-lactate dehydrogenase|uniref:Ldh family oxidoreductase n=1 Tax=Ramlibacter sp. TaxID=1917967 RepID=UPI002D310F2D|nr:Ldh family oxidoreductase [Ramlibacter sp.]HZY18135.1 Ldh family oxidoreductase [Ramlibacter sp.]
MPPPTIPAARLEAFALQLLLAAGMPDERAQAVATVLVEGDLTGHTTHGLQLLAPYLAEIEKGAMRVEGDPLVVSDQPAAQLWDGCRLPGPWLVLRALDAATQRARQAGTGTVVIRRSHHIASLASYHRRAAEQGTLLLLACSDPNTCSVAPFGGLTPVFTPNPVSAAFPTGGVPVSVDISTSTTTNGLTNRLHQQGGRLPAPWLIDGHGRPSDDPSVLFAQPQGTILPLGGLDSGHKGFGLSLLVEALTGGLAGHGRADPREGWGATVFVQVIDPQAFAGLEAFERQMGAVAAQCRASRPADPARPVRLPGERAHRLAQEQRLQGVALHDAILPALQPWADRYGVALPA